MTEQMNQAHYVEVVLYLSLFVINNNIYSKLIQIVINNIELLFVMIKISVYMPIKSNVILLNYLTNINSTVELLCKNIKMQFSYCLAILIYRQQIFKCIFLFQ